MASPWAPPMLTQSSIFFMLITAIMGAWLAAARDLSGFRGFGVSGFRGFGVSGNFLFFARASWPYLSQPKYQ